MEVIKTNIEGLLEIIPNVFEDDRGYFYESFNKEIYNGLGITDEFLQDNQSMSSSGVLRGLHFQNPPFAQGKLVRVVTGAVLDIAVDIRKNSPTYGKHHSVVLTEENKKLFWIPPGFAHGFKVLRDKTIFSYKCTNGYNKASEGAVRWNDPALGIDWGENLEPILSEKDMNSPLFAELESQF